MTLKDEVWRALRGVPGPGFERDVVSFGLVESVAEAPPGSLEVRLRIGHVAGPARDEILWAADGALGRLAGVRTVRLSVAAPPDRPGVRPSPGQVSRGANLRRMIALGSGTGGVGKSTVAVNLAVGPLARRGPARRPRPGHGVDRAHGRARRPAHLASPIPDRLIREFTTDVSWGALDALVVDLFGRGGGARLGAGTAWEAIAVAAGTRARAEAAVGDPRSRARKASR